MKKPSSPCFGCENRSCVCRKTCKDWHKFELELNNYNKFVKSEKEKEWGSFIYKGKGFRT